MLDIETETEKDLDQTLAQQEVWEQVGNQAHSRNKWETEAEELSDLPTGAKLSYTPGLFSTKTVHRRSIGQPSCTDI